MKRTITFLAFIIATILSVGCNAQQNKMLDEAKMAITKSNDIYRGLFLKNDGSILTCYADDACILAPDVPTVCGKEALKNFFTEAYAAGVRGGKFIQLKVYGDGKEFVTEEGLWQALDDNDNVVGNGKYLVLWKKTAKGWKMFRDSFSSDKPSRQ